MTGVEVGVVKAQANLPDAKNDQSDARQAGEPVFVRIPTTTANISEVPGLVMPILDTKGK